MTLSDKLIQHLESFEQYLGNPEHNESPVNFHQSLLADEQEVLAEAQIEFIRKWGYNDCLIPHYLGGALHGLVDLYNINRLIARRDLTTSLALGLSFLGALPIWLAGSNEQKKELALRLQQGDVIALAITEEEHGSDLTNSDSVARVDTDGWEISARKWCVNFATIGQMASVLCRTHEHGGLLGFSLFLLDKKAINKGLSPSPRLPTHGVRGLDISGFSLNQVHVPQQALIGNERRGLEITYKTFQISRVLCTCLSLGGADTALRMSLTFSLQRMLYGKPAYEIPVVKQRLGLQFVQLLIADCTALTVIRAATIMPEKMSFWSAIIKFLVPEMGEDIVEQCSIVLGARAYLRTGEWAMFQKIRRDIQVVGLFDGSSQVNLSLIAGNLLPQAGMRGTCKQDNLDRLNQLFNVDAACPDFAEDNLRLFSHEEDDVFAGLFNLDAKPVQHLVLSIQEQIRLLDQQVIALRDQGFFDPRSLVAFQLAEQYCWLFAASCCLQFWHHNQSSLVDELKDLDWLNLAIQFILNKLNVTKPMDVSLQDAMAEKLSIFYQQNKLFSVIPITLAE